MGLAFFLVWFQGLYGASCNSMCTVHHRPALFACRASNGNDLFRNDSSPAIVGRGVGLGDLGRRYWLRADGVEAMELDTSGGLVWHHFRRVLVLRILCERDPPTAKASRYRQRPELMLHHQLAFDWPATESVKVDTSDNGGRSGACFFSVRFHPTKSYGTIISFPSRVQLSLLQER